MRDAGVRERALQRLGRVPGPREREDLAGGVPPASASAIWAVTQFASANSFANARPAPGPGPRIAISAFGAALVVAHAADGGLEDLRARAEVPPEHDLGVARVAL